MDKKQILTDTINSLLAEGVDFFVKYDNPGILRRIGLLPKEKRFVIYPIKLGTLILISKEILSIDVGPAVSEKDDAIDIVIRNIATNTDKLVKIIAIAITNSPADTSRLEAFIRKNMTPKEMYSILKIVISQMDVKDFLSSIMSVRGMSLLKAEE